MTDKINCATPLVSLGFWRRIELSSDLDQFRIVTPGRDDDLWHLIAVELLHRPPLLRFGLLLDAVEGLSKGVIIFRANRRA